MTRHRYSNNKKNKKKVEEGIRKDPYGRDYQARYKQTGQLYDKDEHQRPDGKFKKGNKAGSYQNQKVLSKDQFRKQMNDIARQKLTPEVLEKLLDQLVAMAIEGKNIHAIKELKEYILGKEGTQNSVDINVSDKEGLVWNYGFDAPQKRKQLKNIAEDDAEDDDDIIDVEVVEGDGG